MSFHVGQRVVCIDDDWEKCSAPSLPKKGEIYRVADIEPPGYGCMHCPFLRLREFDGNAFASVCFRPVIERSTDAGMAILRHILADHKAPSRVDAQMNEHDIFDQERA